LRSISQLLHEAAFGEATPLGGSLYAEDLEALDIDDVLAFRSAHFTSGNLTVTATNVNHESLEQVLQCFLHGLPAGKTAATASPYVGGDFRLRTSLGGKSYLGLGFPVPAGEAGAFIDR
jgi:predicted Zn-dependent peptidase